MYGERLENVALLGHPADTRCSTFKRRQRVQRHTAKGDAPGMLARGTGQGVHQRRLAGSVATQQGQGFTLGQREIDAREHHGFAVTGAQIFYFQQLSHG